MTTFKLASDINWSWLCVETDYDAYKKAPILKTVFFSLQMDVRRDAAGQEFKAKGHRVKGQGVVDLSCYIAVLVSRSRRSLQILFVYE